MHAPDTYDDDPGLDGPDYVALVIEWEDDFNVPTIVRAREPSRAPVTRKIATMAGALIAIAFATWGLHRLRVS